MFMRAYERLSELYFLHFSMSFRLLNTQSFHQPSVLLSSNAERLVLTPRPLELALFKSLVEQEETIAFPIESLDSIGSSAAEQKQRGKRSFIRAVMYFGADAADFYRRRDVVIMALIEG